MSKLGTWSTHVYKASSILCHLLLFKCASSSSGPAPVLSAGSFGVGTAGTAADIHLQAGGSGSHFHGPGHRGGHGQGYKRCEGIDFFPDLGTAGLVADNSFASRPTIIDAPDVARPVTVPPAAPVTNPTHQPPVDNNVPINDVPSPHTAAGMVENPGRTQVQ
ncbi:MAG: hypothetical protein ABJP93_10730, partial [Marinobacter sp.]|uniref:hypothetical protein n=1 Tax=Marinobacter sp. TaxID=50741 RepID=UPI003296B70C